MKKMLCAAALLMFTTTALAANPEACTEITVRFTAFTMLARSASTKQEYDGVLYKMLLEGDADKDNQRLIAKLIELGWTARKEDVNTTAMTLYRACMSPDANT